MTNNTDDFTTVKVAGCSLFSLEENLGWNQDASTLSLRVYEDTDAGDAFTCPNPGSTVYFQLNNITKAGIVQRWIKITDIQNNPAFELNLIDPREILAGSVIVTDAWSGSTTEIPNIVNAYGAYGFGFSGTNDSGMPWLNILPILADFRFQFINETFTVDLSQLPVPSQYYRIQGRPTVGVLEAIDQLCADGGCDYFIRLETGNVIKFYTISRFQDSPSAINKIRTFVNSNSDLVVSYNYGKELRNETTSTVLFGGPVEELTICTQIEPFWGFDINGQPILSRGRLALDVRHLNLPISQYVTSVMEIAVAGAGKESWEMFLAVYRPGIQSLLGFAPKFNFEAFEAAINDRNGVFPSIDSIINAGQSKGTWTDSFAGQERKEALFGFLQGVFNTYYGKKFAVKIPNAERYIDAETNTVKFSLEVVDSGWKEQLSTTLSTFINRFQGSWYNSTFDVPDEAKPIFQNIEQKYEPFAKFNTISGFESSLLTPGEYYYNGSTLYTKCSTDGNIFVLSDENQYQRFSLVGLGPQGQLLTRLENTQYLFGQSQNFFELEDFFTVVTFDEPLLAPGWSASDTTSDALRALDASGPNSLFSILGFYYKEERGITQTAGGIDIDKVLQQLAESSVLYKAKNPVHGVPYIPEAVGIPIRNTQVFYGPWTAYRQGVKGRVEVKQDMDLVPWKYGGLNYMNIAGSEQVIRATQGQQIVETGSVELAGLPTVSIGDTLIGNGPTVTNVNINYNPGGVTTVYQMQTFTPRFGDFGREKQAFIARSGRIMNQLTKANWQAYKTSIVSSLNKFAPGAGAAFLNGFGRFGNLDNAEVGSSFFIGGLAGPNKVAQCDMYNFLSSCTEENWQKFGGSSSNSIFRIFSTAPHASGNEYFPAFKSNASGDLFDGVAKPHRDTLFPFPSGHDMQVMSGSGFTNIQNSYDPNHARPIALRGPLMLAGWGYGTNGKPVPNANPNGQSDEFKSGYLTSVKDWKVGPVDLRWDDSKQLWVGGSTVTLGMVIAFSGGGYICRQPESVSENGIQYDPSTAAFGSGVVDKLVYNIQEGNARYPTIGKNSPVFIYNIDGVYFMNEHPRTYNAPTDFGL